MTPLQTSAAVRNALASVPNTRSVTVVSASKPGVSVSALDSLLGFGKIAKDTVLDIFAPNDFNVPGAAPIARATAKGIVRVADAAGSTIDTVTNSVKTVTNSAAEGAKTGFKYAALILVLVVGIWVWSVVKPR